MEEVKKKELFWVEKIEKALNTLVLGEGKEINIINNEVCLSISELEYNFKLWIRDNGIEIIPSFDPKVTLTFSEDDLEALTYLLKMKNAQTFLWVIGRWIEKREKAKEETKQKDLAINSIKKDLYIIKKKIQYLEKSLDNVLINPPKSH